ncbi:uncharacterized protein PGTG_15004 [Puccinia graminis f. sp. tritici CRL 75-36-700-3]|uniref:Uncharacterized protein n=1 Tax=Puccinia graminis f. sp. tritici (strain CRL 75-36-700-3 / race SCCL) TaxID=418459 RepID=E3KY83_PUCGT|nr:uncharacterized protein PGTG_15004 [Puccinia graminis f. sp. tritici CRL 75-36-700-3]EFP89163.2 hypothetical protein PGTG_15004 [Puccinia graminis f. sp. tritici CRL 75-36-700-3]
MSAIEETRRPRFFLLAPPTTLQPLSPARIHNLTIQLNKSYCRELYQQCPCRVGPGDSCINYNGDPYTCRTLDCYIGDPNSRPDLPPYPLLLFKNCRKMLSDYNLGPPINQTHPIWYHADNQAQTLEAQIDGSGDKYLCTWTESTDPNNVRPYCDGCSSADTENSQP